MALEISRTAVVRSLITWGMSAIVALVVGLFVVHLKDDDGRKPCKDKACFILLDKRIAVLEANMLQRTKDRYTGTDARRDRETAQQEISLLRKELNERIDAMHRR